VDYRVLVTIFVLLFTLACVAPTHSAVEPVDRLPASVATAAESDSVPRDEGVTGVRLRQEVDNGSAPGASAQDGAIEAFARGPASFALALVVLAIVTLFGRRRRGVRFGRPDRGR